MKVERIKVDCWKIGDLIVVYNDEYPNYPTIELYDYDDNVSLNRDQGKIIALLILDLLKEHPIKESEKKERAFP